MNLYSGPIQGITDFHFRNLHAKYFGGIDKYFLPYIRIDKGEVNRRKLKDCLPENNSDIPLVAQVMANSTDSLVYLSNLLIDMGYKEINWNLGCPYPMVTNRKMGAGLLAQPQEVINILEQSLPKIKADFSIKLRSGLLTENEGEALLRNINQFNLSEVIVHPRLASQLYKGVANKDFFLQIIPSVQHPLCYNGDIDSLETFQLAEQELAPTHNWMIGRGLIQNPFLAKEIKEGEPLRVDERLSIFSDFHAELASLCLQSLEGDTQFLRKMTGYWEYFAIMFNNPHKAFKRIKKAKNRNKFWEAVQCNLEEGV